jgi:Predicted Fe-S oxidoreductases
MKILLFNGCWTPNIGNAFVNIGMEMLLKKAFPDCEIYYSADTNNKWMFSASINDNRYVGNSLNISSYMQVDLAVWGGMMLTKEFIDTAGDVFQSLTQRGIPIMLLGAGCDKYDKEEATLVSEYLKGLNIAGIITRDNDTFDLFCNYNFLKDKLVKGIDCGFFLSEYHALKLDIEPFDVECFDRIPAPYIEHSGKKVIFTHHECFGKLPVMFINKPDTLVSELPYDYISLYANVDTVYAERVHACIAALAFGKKAMLFSDTNRASLFSCVLPDGCTITELKSRPVDLDINKLHLKEQQMIDSIIELWKAFHGNNRNVIIQDGQMLSLLQVYIETVSFCNRKCEYCYHSDEKINQNKKTMDENVFDKIISDLKERNYSNLLYLYAINEPLLDKRMAKLIKKAATALPNAKIYLFSNGDLASIELINEFFENGLTHFVFSIHDHSNDSKIDEIINSIGKDNFTIADMTILSPDMFVNRGGSIKDPNIASQKLHDQSSCMLPFRQIAINSDGDIRLCCSIHDEILLENVLNVNIFDYFMYNEKLNSYRVKLGKHLRNELFPCTNCSYDGDNTEGIVNKLGDIF